MNFTYGRLTCSVSRSRQRDHVQIPRHLRNHTDYRVIRWLVSLRPGLCTIVICKSTTAVQGTPTCDNEGTQKPDLEIGGCGGISDLSLRVPLGGPTPERVQASRFIQRFCLETAANPG